ncbi:MAG: hypothetical protein B6244_11310 [Candidatus Cloacimonetes bacterium 4572_55]|nr:MAG: hypothetical protein B6244_11310 [Candidatus Cloacimonetes bacterium 4572_55]
MKLSVCITTYNHESYIAQAIDSVLRQETDFDFEILIGEDDSKDQTREIVKAYKDRYPDKIRLFLHDRKNVIYISGIATGRWNFTNNLKHAKGQYVALLDGDDYWTDPLKLQKQVDFLDAHPDFAISFHNVRCVWQDGSQPPFTLCAKNMKEEMTIHALLRQNTIPTAAVVYRSGLFREFPTWYFEILPGDWPLHILNAEHGKIKYFDQVMSVYRLHQGGIWTSKKDSFIWKERLKLYMTINSHFNFKYNDIIEKSTADCFYKLAVSYHIQNDKEQANWFAKEYRNRVSKWIRPFDSKYIKLLIRFRMPMLLRMLDFLRGA